MSPPQFPVGPFDSESLASRNALILEIQDLPNSVGQVIAGLTDDQLDTRYKNWTIRQIVHHIADSHVNSYVRFKWTLTEDQPTIKAYDEGAWSALEDARKGAVGAPLALLEGLHARWVQLLESLTPDQFSRSFVHPQTNEVVTLEMALRYYVWHGRHHLGQIQWLKTNKGW